MSETTRPDVARMSTGQLARLAGIEEGSAEPVFDYHDEYYRRMFRRSGRQYPTGSRWCMQLQTSPSGKAMFRCRECYRFSVTPDKNCRAGCGKEEAM